MKPRRSRPRPGCSEPGDPAFPILRKCSGRLSWADYTGRKIRHKRLSGGRFPDRWLTVTKHTELTLAGKRFINERLLCPGRLKGPHLKGVGVSVAKTSSKKPAASVKAKSAGKSTTKAKAAPPKRTTKTTTKLPAPKVAAKAPAPAPKSKAGVKISVASVPPPRVTAPPKSKSALTRTDKLERREIDSVRSSNGKPAAAAVQVPRVTPAPGAPKALKAKSAKSSDRAARAPREGILIPRPTNPGKNAAGLSARELEHFRELLLAKRRELVGDMYSMEREALQRSGENLSNLPIHMADMGTDNYEQEFTLGLMEKDRQLLREINTALLKIQNGMYGICEGTNKPISKARLEVQPWAKYSIEHARKLE